MLGSCFPVESDCEFHREENQYWRVEFSTDPLSWRWIVFALFHGAQRMGDGRTVPLAQAHLLILRHLARLCQKPPGAEL